MSDWEEDNDKLSDSWYDSYVSMNGGRMFHYDDWNYRACIGKLSKPYKYNGKRNVIIIEVTDAYGNPYRSKVVSSVSDGMKILDKIDVNNIEGSLDRLGFDEADEVITDETEDYVSEKRLRRLKESVEAAEDKVVNILRRVVPNAKISKIEDKIIAYDGDIVHRIGVYSDNISVAGSNEYTGKFYPTNDSAMLYKNRFYYNDVLDNDTVRSIEKEISKNDKLLRISKHPRSAIIFFDRPNRDTSVVPTGDAFIIKLIGDDRYSVKSWYGQPSKLLDNTKDELGLSKIDTIVMDYDEIIDRWINSGEAFIREAR